MGLSQQHHKALTAAMVQLRENNDVLLTADETLLELRKFAADGVALLADEDSQPTECPDWQGLFNRRLLDMGAGIYALEVFVNVLDAAMTLPDDALDEFAGKLRQLLSEYRPVDIDSGGDDEAEAVGSSAP